MEHVQLSENDNNCEQQKTFSPIIQATITVLKSLEQINMQLICYSEGLLMSAEPSFIGERKTEFEGSIRVICEESVGLITGDN